jgi:hypothetical protein
LNTLKGEVGMLEEEEKRVSLAPPPKPKPGVYDLLAKISNDVVVRYVRVCSINIK